MKFEKVFFRMSVTETIRLLVFFFLVLNGFIFLMSLLQGNPRFLFYDTAWVIQIVFPIGYVFLMNSINRNGVLIISDFNDSTTLMQQIESILFKRGYIPKDPDTKNVVYVRRTRGGRFLNKFFREDIRVQIERKEILVFAKRNMILQVLMKLKYSKQTDNRRQMVT